MANYTNQDFWSLKAQKEGYPARSVYKLKEIDEKFGLLPSRPKGTPGNFRVLDLGAAPGSWSLYVLRKLGDGCCLTAVDLSPLSRQYDRNLFEGERFFFIRGDITDAGIREAILARGPYHLVMSDAAPATTGNRPVDTLRSLALAEAVLEYAETALAPEGSLVVKVFQGGETQGILKRVRELFSAGKSFKPAACRSESFETYYVGIGKNRVGSG
jgi:23S rRNA (uridine2552-2'-O)-methyltransferase